MHEPQSLSDIVTSVTSNSHETQVTNHIDKLNDTSQMGQEYPLCIDSFPQITHPSDIIQCDGADTVSQCSNNDSMNSYDSEDEADSNPVRAVLVPSQMQGPAGDPLRLEVDLSEQVQLPSCIPLCAVTNPRSGWNKIKNIRTFLQQVAPDVLVLSEHWGRKRAFESILASQYYKVIESSRGLKGIPTKGRNGQPKMSVTGGGVAIIYNEENFFVENAGIEPPEGVEAAWAILTPKDRESETVKKILIGGIYIAPQSQHKQKTIDHIIESMFLVQSKYDCKVRFLVTGDFNKVNIDNLMESNGALQQVCTVATRKSSTLELVITDMATMFHPPTTLDPLKQDENTPGKPSDHGVIIVAPKSDVNFRLERHKRKVHVRPMPKSRVAAYMRDVGTHNWSEVFNCDDPHQKAEQFHNIIVHKMNNHIPEKVVKMTTLDKNWFNPSLKMMYNEMHKEYFKNGKSSKWKRLRSNFNKEKRKASKQFYAEFVANMKTIKPGQYYKMAKKIGGIEQTNHTDLHIECLEGMNPQQQVEAVAEAFASVSCEYEPVKLSELPAYLPAEEAPKIEVYKVYQRIQEQKKTKSTLPIDIPQALRKEAAEFLAEPLTDIFNACLEQGIYPRPWKKEWVTPVPKGKPNIILKSLKDVRKIASTSDYSKIFEHCLLDLINKDISHKLSKRQYGGKKGVGTEHLIISLIDQLRKYQDDPQKLAVGLNSYDWSAAFDKLDPTKVAVKCIDIGIRSSIV